MGFVQSVLVAFAQARKRQEEGALRSALQPLLSSLPTSFRTRLLRVFYPLLPKLDPVTLFDACAYMQWYDSMLWLDSMGGSSSKIYFGAGPASDTPGCVCCTVAYVITSMLYRPESPSSKLCVQLALAATSDIYYIHELYGITLTLNCDPETRATVLDWVQKWKRWLRRAPRQRWLLVCAPFTV